MSFSHVAGLFVCETGVPPGPHDAVGVMEGVGVTDGVGVIVGVCVTVPVVVGVSVTVPVFVTVGVLVTVYVDVGVLVLVGVHVFVGVRVGVCVTVPVVVGVSVGVSVCADAAEASRTTSSAMPYRSISESSRELVVVDLHRQVDARRPRGRDEVRVPVVRRPERRVLRVVSRHDRDRGADELRRR